jgi:hypothetical protein
MRAIPAADSAGCANPQITATIFEKALYSIVAQPLSHCEPRGSTLRDAHHTLVVRTEPECTGVIFKRSANSETIGGRW